MPLTSLQDISQNIITYKCLNLKKAVCHDLIVPLWLKKFLLHNFNPCIFDNRFATLSQENAQCYPEERPPRLFLPLHTLLPSLKFLHFGRMPVLITIIAIISRKWVEFIREVKELKLLV